MKYIGRKGAVTPSIMTFCLITLSIKTFKKSTLSIIAKGYSRAVSK
jgi:hypothetical protein